MDCFGICLKGARRGWQGSSPAMTKQEDGLLRNLFKRRKAWMAGLKPGHDEKGRWIASEVV
jgi:hypothetical protein